MVFEAILFLAGAVLFFLSVLFFVFLCQDRTALARQREALETEVVNLKEQRVELDIREHELLVWSDGLEHQQKALELAQEELRMITVTQQLPETLLVDRSDGEEDILVTKRASRDQDVPRNTLKNVK